MKRFVFGHELVSCVDVPRTGNEEDLVRDDSFRSNNVARVSYHDHADRSTSVKSTSDIIAIGFAPFNVCEWP